MRQWQRSFGIGLLLLGCCYAAQAVAVLTGDTSHPTLSTFAQGDPVELTFTVNGLSATEAGCKLQLRIVDEHGTAIDSKELPVTDAGNGTWTTTVPAPGGHLGFYRVYAKLSTGVELAAIGSRSSGYLTYAIVPDPATRVLYNEKESRFGLCGGFGPWRDEVCRYLGARWLLGGFGWKTDEPDHAGQFAEKVAAGQVKLPTSTTSWPLYFVPPVFSSPKWAVIPETAAYNTGTLNPEGEKGWDAYCRQVGKILSTAWPDRQEHIYQITWEPNYPWGFKGTDEDLMKIYEIAHSALHRADAKAVVAGPTFGGIGDGDVETTVRLLKKGFGRYIDAYAIHPYFAIEPETGGMIRNLRMVKEALRQYCGHDVPIIGTEQGFSTGEDLGKELTQARGLIRQDLIALGEGFRFNMGFYIVDYHMGSEKGFGYYYNLVKNVPWGPAKASPKPVVPAFAAASAVLDGHQSAGAIEWLGGSSWGYVFERGTNEVLAVWDYGTQPRDVTIPTGVGNVTVYDWMGNARTIPTPDGNVTVTLSQEPQYIAGVSPKLWGSHAEKLLVSRNDHVTACPGERVSITGIVKTPAGKGVQGTVILSPDSKLGIPDQKMSVTLAKGKQREFSFPISIPATTAPGSYSLKVLLRDNTNGMAVLVTTLRVQSPVTIADISPITFPHGSVGFAVTVQNEQENSLSGELAAQISGVPETTRKATITLAKGGSQRVTIVYPADTDLAPSVVYQAQIIMTMKNGYTFTQSFPVDFLRAYHTTKPMDIDGSFADWNGIPALALRGREAVIRSPQYYAGVDDVSAQLRYAWDDRALYLAVEVNDDAFYQAFTGFDIWRNDCLQLAFNLDPHQQEISTGNQFAEQGMKRRVTEIGVALTPKGAEAYRHGSYDPEKLPVGPLAAEKVKLVVKNVDGKLCYEMAIPWSTLGADRAPKSDEVIGVAMAVNDSDDAKQLDPSALGLFGGITPSKDPNKFGLLLLGGTE
ncbi:MAG TPA: sugar-binding protein [Armatimonadota bacterium]|nr:sugar-binding protein [Armatimonadota bacterium]